MHRLHRLNRAGGVDHLSDRPSFGRLGAKRGPVCRLDRFQERLVEGNAPSHEPREHHQCYQQTHRCPFPLLASMTPV